MNIIRPLFLLMLCCRGCCSLAIAGDLPANDAGKNQLIIVGQPDAAPARWFNDIPELAQTKSAIAFTLFPPNSKLFKERYQATLGTDFPIVAYLRPDGGVVYFADRHSLPSNGIELLKEMKAAAFMAKNAKPATKLPQDLDTGVQQDYQDTEDCGPDGCSPLDDPTSSPRFPKLRPFRNNPLDNQPVDRLFGGFFSDAIGSGVGLVFSIVALGFLFLFMVLIFGAMIVISKMW
jgi:hypothetical protein